MIIRYSRDFIPALSKLRGVDDHALFTGPVQFLPLLLRRPDGYSPSPAPERHLPGTPLNRAPVCAAVFSGCFGPHVWVSNVRLLSIDGALAEQHRHLRFSRQRSLRTAGAIQRWRTHCADRNFRISPALASFFQGVNRRCQT